MKISSETAKLLDTISNELILLKAEVEYKGYWEDRISNEDAIAVLCGRMNDLVEILQSGCQILPEITKEDYEAIYGWGGQG
jgi:hypothetical protein